MKTALSFLLCLLLAAGAFAQSSEPVRTNGLYGFAENGRTVIPAQFRYATHFREGLALVQQPDGKWGFIDSTGKWVVPPKFDAAQPFVNGRSYIFLNGKAGIIAPDGNYIVEPVYDTFEETWYGMLVTRNFRKGYIVKNWNKIIPPEYIDFGFADGFISAKRDDFTVDLYYNGKLLLENAQRLVDWDDVQHGIGQALVSVNDSMGVIDTLGNWVIPPHYRHIEHFDFQPVENPNGGRLWSGLYKLDNTTYTIYADGNGNYDPAGPVITWLAKENGDVIGSGPLEIAGIRTDKELPYIEVVMDGKIAYVQPDLSILPTPYVSIEEYEGWKICSDETQTRVFDPWNTEIAVFERAALLQSTEMVYNETGEPVETYTGPSGIPCLAVYRETPQGEENALFDLRSERLITHWSADRKSVSFYQPFPAEVLYFIHNDDKLRYSYYHSAMDRPSGFDYISLECVSPGIVTGLDSAGDLEILFSLSWTKGVEEILRAPQIGNSADLSRYGDERYNPETGGVEYSGAVSFEMPFWYYKNAQGKYGIVTRNGWLVSLLGGEPVTDGSYRVLPALYDTLLPNTLPYIVSTRLGDLWGAVDLRNGNTVVPAYSEPLEFALEGYSGITYSRWADSCYIDTKGRRFFSLSGEYELFKEKGIYGLETWSEFSDDELWVTVVPARYKSIRLTEYPNRFIAKGINGRFGVIDNFSDTILPFMYTSIGYAEEMDGMSSETPLFSTTIGKKKGLAFIGTGQAIPAEYDGFSQLKDHYGAVSAVVVRSGEKVGLYSTSFEPLLSCTYDAIYVLPGETQTEMRLQKNGKWYVVGDAMPGLLTEKKALSGRAYDLVIDDLFNESYGYVKTPGGYDRYAITGGALLAKDLDESNLIVNDPEGYRLFVRDGKIGAADSSGNIVLKPQLTSISTWEDGTVVSAKDGEKAYYVLGLKQQFKESEW